MEETQTEAHDTERRLLAAALAETTGAIIVTEDGFEAVDSLAGLDWRDYESAVRTPGGGGR